MTKRSMIAISLIGFLIFIVISISYVTLDSDTGKEIKKAIGNHNPHISSSSTLLSTYLISTMSYFIPKSGLLLLLKTLNARILAGILYIMINILGYLQSSSPLKSILLLLTILVIPGSFFLIGNARSYLLAYYPIIFLYFLLIRSFWENKKHEHILYGLLMTSAFMTKNHVWVFLALPGFAFCIFYGIKYRSILKIGKTYATFLVLSLPIYIVKIFQSQSIIPIEPKNWFFSGPYKREIAHEIWNMASPFSKEFYHHYWNNFIQNWGPVLIILIAIGILYLVYQILFTHDIKIRKNSRLHFVFILLSLTPYAIAKMPLYSEYLYLLIFPTLIIIYYSICCLKNVLGSKSLLVVTTIVLLLMLITILANTQNMLNRNRSIELFAKELDEISQILPKNSILFSRDNRVNLFLNSGFSYSFVDLEKKDLQLLLLGSCSDAIDTANKYGISHLLFQKSKTLTDRFFQIIFPNFEYSQFSHKTWLTRIHSGENYDVYKINASLCKKLREQYD